MNKSTISRDATVFSNTANNIAGRGSSISHYINLVSSLQQQAFRDEEARSEVARDRISKDMLATVQGALVSLSIIRGDFTEELQNMESLLNKIIEALKTIKRSTGK
ncbi:hypothetical protein HZB00_00450 [Candidatus Woesearchaeota archaeon]|nr:hypothetical protein [Candidatus Woesearchaeota archaeon]